MIIKKRFHYSDFFNTDSLNDLSERLLQTYLGFNFHVSLLIDFLFYGRLATEGRKDRITEKERVRSFLFDSAQERLAQIRANRAKADSRERESRERS